MNKVWDEPMPLCPHCEVEIGQPHAPGCDLEHCPTCGLQVGSCDHQWPEADRLKWTGFMHGEQDAVRFGYWAKFVPGSGWVACGKDEPGAMPDLNTLLAKTSWSACERAYRPRGFASFDEYVAVFPAGERHRAWVTNNGRREVVILLTSGHACTLTGGYHWAAYIGRGGKGFVIVSDCDDGTRGKSVASAEEGRRELDTLLELAPFDMVTDLDVFGYVPE